MSSVANMLAMTDEELAAELDKWPAAALRKLMMALAATMAGKAEALELSRPDQEKSQEATASAPLVVDEEFKD